MRLRRSESPLIGRRAELDAVRSALAQSRRGSGVALFFEGAAGLGKSRLLREACGLASDVDFRVLSGAAEELEQGRPLGVLGRILGMANVGGALHAVPANDVSLVPMLQSSVLDTLPDTHWLVADKVIELIESMADTEPVLLAVDDLHVADPVSLSVLLALGRRLSHMRVCLIAAFRPAPVRRGLERLLEALPSAHQQRIALTELTEQEAQELLTAALGGPTPPEVAPLVRAAAGNPFYLLEVAAVAREGTATSGEPLPPRLRDAVLRHVRNMSEEELTVLRTAAVLGSPFSVADLATVCGLSVAGLHPMLDRWIALHLLADASTDNRLVFRHDLVRLTVYATMPAALRTSLHVAVARAMAAGGGAAAHVAHHLALGAAPGDLAALEWLQRGAEELADRDPDGAVNLLERALRIAGSAPKTVRVAIRANLVEALARVGRTSEAKHIAGALLREGSLGSAELPLRRGLAIIAFLEGGIAGAAEELDQQVHVAQSRGTVPARTLAELALFKVASADLTDARDLVARAALVERDDRAASTLRRSVEALLALYECRLNEAVAVATDARTLAELEADDDAGMQAHRYHPTFFQALALTDADRFDEAAEAVRRGHQLCTSLGTTWAPPLYHCVAATRLLKMGAWDDAEVEADAARAFIEEFKLSVGAVWPHALLARLAALRDDVESARTAVERGEREVAEKGLQFGTDLLIVTRAHLLEIDGAAGDAAAVLSLAWGQAADLGLHNVHRVLGPALTRLLVATGHLLEARDISHTLMAVASRSNTPSLRAAALQCAGIATEDPDTLLEAVNAWREGNRPYDLAETTLDAAIVLLRGGRRSEALVLFEEANTLANSLGAARLAYQAAQRLPRNRRSAQRIRPRSGWASLTPTEVQVVRLLAQGLSNGQIAQQLFISRRTAESHLYHIFAKLGVGSRVELAVQATARFQ
jgi:DNA-binding CsgD family transcriptional regulator